MGFDAKMEGYDLVEVDGRVCLFSYMRLDRNSVPEGIFCYEVEDSEREDRSFGKIKSVWNTGGWEVSFAGKSCQLGRMGSIIRKIL